MHSELMNFCGGAKGSCSHTPVRSLFVKKWAGLNRFESSTDCALCSVRGLAWCMNVVTVITLRARVPVTLNQWSLEWNYCVPTTIHDDTFNLKSPSLSSTLFPHSWKELLCGKLPTGSVSSQVHWLQEVGRVGWNWNDKKANFLLHCNCDTSVLRLASFFLSTMYD